MVPWFRGACVPELVAARRRLAHEVLKFLVVRVAARLRPEDGSRDDRRQLEHDISRIQCGCGRKAVFLDVGGTFVNHRGVVPPSAREAVVAGSLQDIFAVDVPAAVGRCDTCGRAAPIAEVRVLDHGPGVVARCPVCDQVLARLVRGPGAWRDVRGLAYL